jgi:Bacterial aa3 type cytochrome c oxidase subunit IV
MAEQASRHEAQDMSGHARTYEGFLKGSVILALCCIFILLALVNVGFNASHPYLMAFLGIVIGFLAVLIDARSGGRWMLAMGVLLVYALFTAMSIV